MEKKNEQISIILSVSGEGHKLPPFIIVKGEEGKTDEKKLNNLYFVKNGDLFVHCQKDGCCT